MIQGGLSHNCDEGEQEEKMGGWTCAGLGDSKSSQLKIIQGAVTGYAGDLGESSNSGVKTPDLVVLWQHYALEHDG